MSLTQSYHKETHNELQGTHKEMQIAKKNEPEINYKEKQLTLKKPRVFESMLDSLLIDTMSQKLYKHSVPQAPTRSNKRQNQTIFCNTCILF